MKYRTLTNKESDSVVIHILDTLLDDSVPYSGAHRKRQWEKGWGENLKSGNGIPKYFGKYPIQRLNGKFVRGYGKNYERDMLYTIVDSMAQKYLSTCLAVCEFGCGTGHNLRRIRKASPTAKLWGLDWTQSSKSLVESMGFNGYTFDYFKPDYDFKLTPNTGVYTVASLEQIGTGFKPFVQYLLKNKPSVVVHIEPIPELLDETKLIDYLSIRYMFKRKYLRGYLTYLQMLEKKGKIKILESRRSGIGSLFIDGYSVVVWKPI